MRRILLDVLVCPQCKGTLTCMSQEVINDDEIYSGQLSCAVCDVIYPIVRAIPRFVASSNYTNSFGYQWNKYKYTQIDRYAKIDFSRERFDTESGWDKTQIQAHEWMLDAGCGNGRFLDIATETKAQVVGLDMSNAVDAAYELLKDRKNLHLVQANMFQAPFKEGTFDYVYSIGVIQHTPDPEKTIRSISALVKKGGKIAVTIYEKNKYTLFNAKYWFRPIAKRFSDKTVLNAIKFLSPVLFPLTNVLYRLPRVNKVFQFFIPYANYVHLKTPLSHRYTLSILDTFDMLKPQYDLPQRQEDVERYLTECGVQKIQRLPNPGLNLVGERVS